MTDDSLWAALATSPSFWRETLPLATAAVSGATACCIWAATGVKRRRRAFMRTLLRDESASAVAVDFVLTFPLAIVFVCVTVQFALLANASFVTHYAAYSAARSARVHLWNPRPLLWLVQFNWLPTSTLSDTNARLAALYYYNVGGARSRAFDAACLSLAAIAPAAGPTATQGGGAQRWERYLDQLAAASGTSGPGVFRRKVDYACRAGMTAVDIFVDGMSIAGALLSSPPAPLESLPVRSEVAFRYRLVLPPGPIFGTREPDGHYTRLLSAEVTVP